MSVWSRVQISCAATVLIAAIGAAVVVHVSDVPSADAATEEAGSKALFAPHARADHSYNQANSVSHNLCGGNCNSGSGAPAYATALWVNSAPRMPMAMTFQEVCGAQFSILINTYVPMGYQWHSYISNPNAACGWHGNLGAVAGGMQPIRQLRRVKRFPSASASNASRQAGLCVRQGRIPGVRRV